MNPILFAKPYPGATTCILIGGLGGGELSDLGEMQGMLWIVASEDAQPVPRSLAHGTVEIVPPDRPAAEIQRVVERFVARTPRHLPSLYCTRGTLGRQAALYEAAASGVFAVLEQQHRARITREKDGFTWQRHLLQNLPAFLGRRIPGSWQGALAGLPAFVCGAGPSLDVTAPRLAAAAGTGVVFAADSALRTLAKHGVAADFVVSVDAAKQPQKCIPDGFIPARVALASISPPTWLDAAGRGRCLFLSGNQITEDWLCGCGVRRSAATVQENCGSTALSLARFLGCAPIYLFGLDLAVDASKPAQRHAVAADSALYVASGYNPDQAMPLVSGNYEERVPTFALGDWRALDARLAGWPAGLVFNVTDRGARFRNTILVAPGDFAVEGSAKADRLERLPQPEAAAPEIAGAAMERLCAVGDCVGSLHNQLQEALAGARFDQVVGILRKFLASDERARLMGGFSFRLMPHLLPPLETDATLWRNIVGEFEELGCVARAVGSASRNP